MSVVPGPGRQSTAPAAALARGPAATYALAGVIAVAACIIFLIPLSLIAAARAGGLYFGYGNPARLLLLLAGAVAVAGLVTAVVIAAVASRTPGRQPSTGVAQAPTPTTRRRVLLGVAAALVVGAILVGVYSGRLAGLFLTFEPLGPGYGMLGRLAVVWAGVIATAGIVAAAIVVAAALLPGRATSLRTRTFGVIVIVVLVPSLCLAGLGAWAYYRSWNVATSIAHDQSNYRAQELGREIRSVQRQPGRFGPADRAKLADAIAQMYASTHPEGAQLATLTGIRQTSTLPVWAIRNLERRGYAIGDEKGATGLVGANIVAWRVGPAVVRYFVPVPGAYDLSSPPVPVDRLFWIGVSGVALIIVLGLLGAWLLSRTVVRPVRRLAAASGRLAEGEAGVTVKPEGPRELRDLAVSFNDMNAKLTKAQETEQAFLLSVSHELKTPLTSIRGYAEGIGDGTVKPDDGAAVIGAESSRLERLVGDLLESGRMRKAAFTVRREAVGLAAVAEDVARRYDATARDAGLTLLINTEAGGGAVADHDRVLQVVSNLVENAIRCTPAPGTVTITTAPGAVTVADTGRGLTSDDLPRAFERFYLYSRYGTDRPVGTGLGLAIVKELTEAMGGTVSVCSAVGVGTAFTVALPADGSTAVTAAAPAPWAAAPSARAAHVVAPTTMTSPAAETAAQPAVPAGPPDPAPTAAPQDDAS